MIRISNKLYCHTFEYLYLFVMVIYMAQMTPNTGRMVGNLSGNPIPLLIPIALTIILLFRHPTSFIHRKLWLFVGTMLTWSVAVCYKFHDFSSSNLSYYFFLIYAIVIAFIHVRVFKRDLFLIYEHIIVILSGISLILWGTSVLFPGVGSFFKQFPETSYGNNFLYLFNYMDPAKEQVYYSIIRNAGCSWEPGRFAIMLTLAIFVNLSHNGVRFKHNKKIFILLLTLASTFSTTGYSITILLYFIFWFKRISVKSVVTFLIFVLPLTIYIFSIDFMAEKIQDNAAFEELTKERMHNIDYNQKKYGDEYLGSLDRFESASFDWMNFTHEPMLGYGRNWDHSWFRQNISTNLSLTGGLVKILAQYGILVAILLYAILFYSSFKISQSFPYGKKLAFALLTLLSSISYNIFCFPLFTAFWLYGLFNRQAMRQSVPVKKTIPVYHDSPLFYLKINRMIRNQERKVVAGDLLTRKEQLSVSGKQSSVVGQLATGSKQRRFNIQNSIFKIVIILLSAIGIGAIGYVAYNLIMLHNEPAIVTQDSSNQQSADSSYLAAASCQQPAANHQQTSDTYNEHIWEKYDKMDSHLQKGEYYIVTLDRIVIAHYDDNSRKIAARIMGDEEWSPYIEAFNGISSATRLEQGQEVKIPKLMKKKIVKKWPIVKKKNVKKKNVKKRKKKKKTENDN